MRRKLFLLSFVYIFISIIFVVSGPSSAYSKKSGHKKDVGADLATCNDNLGVCLDEVSACEADGGQTFPGDGYTNPDTWGVSGHGPVLSYTDNGDGTFTDDNTKLMWEKKLAANDVGGKCVDATQANRRVNCVNNTYTWSNVGGGNTAPNGTLFSTGGFLDTLNNKCDGDETTSCITNDDCSGIGDGLCGFAGHQDWRIPNIKELQGLVDYSKSNAATSVPGPTITILNYASRPYWSATTDTYTPGIAWGVEFSHGLVNGIVDNKSSNQFARAVRP
jgi:hypothetical protein